MESKYLVEYIAGLKYEYHIKKKEPCFVDNLSFPI